MDNMEVPRDALEDLHASLAVVLLHAWMKQRPSTNDLARARQLATSLEFGFSLRAASGFTRHLLRAVTYRLHGRAGD